MSKHSIHPLCLSRPPIQLQTFTLLKTPRIRSDPSRGCSCLRLRFSDIRIAPAEVRSGNQRSCCHQHAAMVSHVYFGIQSGSFTLPVGSSNSASLPAGFGGGHRHLFQPAFAMEQSAGSSVPGGSFQMIMGREFAKCPSQRAFAK